MSSQTYDAVNKAWKSTCKVLLGSEIGDLDEYGDYLKKYVDPVFEVRSCISGKKVLVSSEDFEKGARFISDDESSEYSKEFSERTKLHINDIKDIDSLMRATGEVCYAGNIILGNSAFASDSNRCTNVTCAHSCTDIYDSKYVAYSAMTRYGEYIFGSTPVGESKFNIKQFEAYRTIRCVEGLRTHMSSDCYYTANLEACTNCMFSFNQRSKSLMVGNNQLSREEYAKLRVKLVAEMRDTLIAKKSLPTIVDLVAGGQKEQKRAQLATLPASPAMEKAFESASKVVLGAGLKSISSYSGWLNAHVPQLEKVKSAISEKPVRIGYTFNMLVKCPYVTNEEAEELAKKKVPKEKLEGLSLSNAARLLRGISLPAIEVELGGEDNVDCAGFGLAVRNYVVSLAAYSKNCAYSYWPRQSEHVFGSSVAFSSQFCLKCYHSSNLSRCLEVSDSHSCSDCYFCHNCENLSDCMFCFNAKNLRYAVGNVEVGREEFMRLRGILLAYVQKELEKKKRLDLNVFNVGCKR